MAVCRCCGGDEFDKVTNTYSLVERTTFGMFSHRSEYVEKIDGALWQCRKCKRVFRYRGYGWGKPDGKLPHNKVEV